MWIVPPLVCAIGIVVAFLPPAEPIEDPDIADRPLETSGGWVPMALATTVTLAVITIALRAVLAG